MAHKFQAEWEANFQLGVADLFHDFTVAVDLGQLRQGRLHFLGVRHGISRVAQIAKSLTRYGHSSETRCHCVCPWIPACAGMTRSLYLVCRVSGRLGSVRDIAG